jgi:hypothetical protein
MNKPGAACPRCGKKTDSREELEAMRRRKRAEAQAAAAEVKIETDVPVDSDELDVTDTEVFFDDLGDDDKPRAHGDED